MFSVILAALVQQSKATCWHGLTRKVGKWWKNNNDDKQVNKPPTTTVYNICTYVQNEIKKVNETIDFPQDSKHTFSALYIYENPILGVSTIEDLIKEMSLHMLTKKKIFIITGIWTRDDSYLQK